MKRICILLLAFALLAGLAACGAALPDEQAEASSGTAAASKAAFERALQLYKYFSMESMQADPKDSFERDGVTYWRVIDPEFPTMDALAEALAEVFSIELMRGFLDRTQQDATPWIAVENPAPLYIEAENYTKLYTCMGDRGADISSWSVGAVSESENRIVSKLTALHYDGEERETLLTQELIGGSWVFTDFPLDW